MGKDAVGSTNASLKTSTVVQPLKQKRTSAESNCNAISLQILGVVGIVTVGGLNLGARLIYKEIPEMFLPYIPAEEEDEYALLSFAAVVFSVGAIMWGRFKSN